MKIPNITIEQLLEAGVHLGHKTLRWNPKMKKFIFGKRDSIHIIDLTQTLELTKVALEKVYSTISEGGKILFISTKKQASEAIAELANETDQYFVNYRWLGGMLTNWGTISNSIKKLDNLSRASSVELSEKKRQVELSAISSYQNYKSAIAKTKASESEKKSSLLALNGIKKESEFGIRTILDVLDAEVDFLNASSNLIQSQADEIYSVYQIKSILGSLSIKDINNDLDVKYNLKQNKLDFNILDRRMFN